MRPVNRSFTDRSRSICTLLLVLLWGSLALAQEPGEVTAPDDSLPEDDQDNRQDNGHRIEIIVFRHLDQRGTTPEEAIAEIPARPVDDPATITAAPPIDPAAPALPAAPAAPAGAETAGPWPVLNSAELKLGAVASRLRQSTAYQLLYHGGWSQSLAAQDQTVPTPLPATARAAGLEGTITLYRENFVHVLLDIGLHDIGLHRPATEEAGGDVVYELRQGRRLRGQSAQYFDHPQFGVILQVD